MVKDWSLGKYYNAQYFKDKKGEGTILDKQTMSK
jgi:hypothetical protein